MSGQKKSEKTPLEILGDAYDFKIESDKDPKHGNIDHIIFKDGRKYKLQHPLFMELHKIMFSSDDIDHSLFVAGLKMLYPENDKSLVIDESYLNTHKDEGLYLWSPLIRGLLSSS